MSRAPAKSWRGGIAAGEDLRGGGRGEEGSSDQARHPGLSFRQLLYRSATSKTSDGEDREEFTAGPASGSSN